jgi:hypothetical protein
MSELGVDPLAIDVGHLVRRNVASLYSSLVTRPTGQAVRLAIENVLADEVGPLSLSVVDFSQVTVIDFSCADEVVAKLLLLYQGVGRPRDALFILRGVQDLHRDPIQVVLERHGLVAVAQASGGCFELVGSFSAAEEEVWRALEGRGGVAVGEAGSLCRREGAAAILDRLVERRVAFRNPRDGSILSLSALLKTLARGGPGA